MEQDSKTFLKPGDVVTLKQDIPNKPIMIVMHKETDSSGNAPISTLKGIRCRWFTTDGVEQQAVFSTKELIIL